MEHDLDDYPFDLGSHTMPISTQSTKAQRWFDRGMMWSYSFAHVEARRCFEKVIEYDPDCAMGYWGVAYSVGPYYNLGWEFYSPQALIDGVAVTYKFSQEASKRSEKCSDLERKLIQASTVRFPNRTPPEKNEAKDAYAAWNQAYIEAMRPIYAEYPNNNDVCALTAEALILPHAWQLWDLENRVPADGANTIEALSILQNAIDRTKEANTLHHPGILHFFVHISEMSPKPERALEVSNILMGLIPDTAHLIHMASHIYFLCGDYQKSLESNKLAYRADQKYVDHDPEISPYTTYMLHNLHFQVYSAMFLGQYEPALQVAEEMESLVPKEVLLINNDFWGNFLEMYAGTKPHVLVRFGKWDEIIQHPQPADPKLYCTTNAFWYYAKGVAYAASGDIEKATVQQQRFAEAVELVDPDRNVFNNTCRDILKVGEKMLGGELEYRRKNYDLAFDLLRECVTLYDTLEYFEPWPWMQPPRHTLGALLMEQGHVDEAAAIYRADLGIDDTLVRPSQHVDNIWALHGYVECLEAQKKEEEAAVYRAKLERMEQAADLKITSSCFCRQAKSCCSSDMN